MTCTSGVFSFISVSLNAHINIHVSIWNGLPSQRVDRHHMMIKNRENNSFNRLVNWQLTNAASSFAISLRQNASLRQNEKRTCVRVRENSSVNENINKRQSPNVHSWSKPLLRPYRNLKHEIFTFYYLIIICVWKVEGKYTRKINHL